MSIDPPSHTGLGWLAEVVHRRRWSVISAAIALFVLLGIVAAGAMSSFVLNRWEAAGSESVRAQEALQSLHSTGTANLILLVTARSGDVDDPDVAAAATALTRELASEPAVGDAWSYWSDGADATLRSDDGASALVLAHVEGDATAARAAIAGYIPAYTSENETIRVDVAGSEAASVRNRSRPARRALAPTRHRWRPRQVPPARLP